MAKAGEDLELATKILDLSAAQAARMGYMAAFHAALAAVRAATGTEPKTHNGLRSAFGDLALREPALGSDMGRFIAKAYESKDIADYQTDYEVDRASAEEVISGARYFLERVATYLERP